jgi:hypothetical protein
MTPLTGKRNHKKWPVRKAPFVVIAIFLIIWLVGNSTGEPARVLEQAIQVCFSCIGIG